MIDGIVLVDKEVGCTSHDVVARCRRTFGQRRVGHAGTLDPGASGLLLVGLGRATRLLAYATALPKRYTGEVVLGVATSTLDAGGEETGRWDMTQVGPEEVEAAAARLVGPILQIPPMVSAVKVGGRRLHQLARAGVEVDRPPRPVTVHHLELSPTDRAGVWAIDVSCSSGTYVRSLAAEVGRALGGGAHLRRLRRLAIGSFTVGDAVPVDQLGEDRVLPPLQAVAHLSRLHVDGSLAAAVRHGAVLDACALGVGDEAGGVSEAEAADAGGAWGATGAGAPGGPWAVLDSSGQLLAVYERRRGDRAGLKPSVVMAEGPSGTPPVPPGPPAPPAPPVRPGRRTTN